MKFQNKLSLKNKIPPNMVINPSTLKIVQQFNFRKAQIWVWIMFELIYRRFYFHCLLVWNLHSLDPLPWHQNWIGNEIYQAEYATRSCLQSMSWDKAFINSQILETLFTFRPHTIVKRWRKIKQLFSHLFNFISRTNVSPGVLGWLQLRDHPPSSSWRSHSPSTWPTLRPSIGLPPMLTPWRRLIVMMY